MKEEKPTSMVYLHKDYWENMQRSWRERGEEIERLREEVANGIECRLVMEDWRQTGKADSIYNTPLGVELSDGDLHSGTTFDAVVRLRPDIAEEIKSAWDEHGAYPVFRMLGIAKEVEG